MYYIIHTTAARSRPMTGSRVLCKAVERVDAPYFYLA